MHINRESSISRSRTPPPQSYGNWVTRLRHLASRRGRSGSPPLLFCVLPHGAAVETPPGAFVFCSPRPLGCSPSPPTSRLRWEELQRGHPLCWHLSSPTYRKVLPLSPVTSQSPLRDEPLWASRVLRWGHVPRSRSDQPMLILCRDEFLSQRPSPPSTDRPACHRVGRAWLPGQAEPPAEGTA